MSTKYLFSSLSVSLTILLSITAACSQETEAAPASTAAFPVVTDSSAMVATPKHPVRTETERVRLAGELNMAASNFSIPEVERLLAVGVDPNGRDEKQMTAIETALLNLWKVQPSKAVDVLQILIKGGANINLPAYGIETPPYLEFLGVGNFEAVDLLFHLSPGCDLYPITSKGCSPLSFVDPARLSHYRKHLEERWQNLSEVDRDKERKRLEDLFQKTYTFYPGGLTDPDAPLLCMQNGVTYFTKGPRYSEAIKSEYDKLYRMAFSKDGNFTSPPKQVFSTTATQVESTGEIVGIAFIIGIILSVVIGLVGMVGSLTDRIELGKEVFPWRRVYLSGLIMIPVCLIELALILMVAFGNEFVLGAMILLALIANFMFFARRYYHRYVAAGISAPSRRAIFSAMATFGMAIANCAIIPVVLGVIVLVIGASFARNQRVVVVDDYFSPPKFGS